MLPAHAHFRGILAILLGLLFSTVPGTAPAQNLAKRLILKDGSYQLAAKYEIKGDRVRYYSAERGEWEEIPNSLIDWDATEKYEQGRLQGAPSPEALQLDKEFEAEQKAEDARSPQVSPGLRLSADGGIFLLDTFQNQPQLDELQQSGGELNRNTKSNILRAAINPLASAKQTIETNVGKKAISPASSNAVTSILVSRADKRIYVLQNGNIVAQGDANIKNPGKPIGSNVFVWRAAIPRARPGRAWASMPMRRMRPRRTARCCSASKARPT